MKFVKQSLRQRQSKCSASHVEQENRPPVKHETEAKQEPSTQISSMEEQSVETTRKEEQEYLQDIIQYMVKAPENSNRQADYFKNQPDITEHMRSVLLSWLIDVHLKYKLQTQTLFISIHIIDSYLSRVAVQRNQLQLVGIVAIWIASKYQQTYQVPKIHNLVYICDSAYTRQQILQMQSHIIQILDFNILFNTEFYYFQALNRISNLHPKDYFLCRYILEIALFDIHFKAYHPKVLAASAVYFVRKLRKNMVCWSSLQEKMFVLTENEIKQCAREMCLFWQKAEEIQTLNSLRNKFQSTHYKEVSKIKIGQSIKTQPKMHLRA